VFKLHQARLLLLSAALLTCVTQAAALQNEAATLPDPMRPPTAAPSRPLSSSKAGKRSDTGSYQLSAIRITAGQRSATLNGRTLSVGDRLGSARVTAIQASSVTLLEGGKSRTISLLPLSIKKPVEAPQP
jgi:MSHA biogenesis protein MshK